MYAWIIEGYNPRTKRVDYYAGEDTPWVVDADMAYHFETAEDATEVSKADGHKHRDLVVVEFFFPDYPYGNY